MQFQFSNQNQEASLLNELFNEAGLSNNSGNSSGCQCSTCRANSGNEINPEIFELGWELNQEEEYELSKAFEKIKNLAKRGYNKAKPVIVTADIIRRLIFPATEPVPVMKDVATYIEQDKKRQTQDRVEAAQQPGKGNFKQKPNPEISMIQEIFMESEI
jgi:hypothetical protein